MTRPQFNRYYSGPWPYNSDQGVGLALSGAPTDPHAFIELLQGHSCNPPATRRILDALNRGETKFTTVSDFLPFDNIGDVLAAIGVKMEIVPPRGVPDQRYDHAAFDMIKGETVSLEHFSEAERLQVLAVHAQTLHSLARFPFDFGRFV